VHHRLLSSAVLLLAAAGLPAGQTQAPAIADVLRAAAEYVKGYEGMALVAQEDYAAATGRFEIELATGRVLWSTLTLRSRTANATIEVKFSPNPQIGMYLPQSMTEKYLGSFNGTVTGNAPYSRYRQFKVETSEVMKH
jgi:hypothetical protein